MMQARKRASLVFLSWNGTVNALCDDEAEATATAGVVAGTLVVAQPAVALTAGTRDFQSIGAASPKLQSVVTESYNLCYLRFKGLQG